MKMSLLLLTQINVSPKDFQSKFKDYTKNSSSVFHLNIRSLGKNFESFKDTVKAFGDFKNKEQKFIK